ncbi:MAG: transglycosylase domain-containing protein, partial [Desulfobacterales bacterium]
MGSGKIRISLLLVGSLAIIAGIILGGVAALYHDLPPIRQLESYTPSAITRIYAADDQLLTELFTERRDPAALAEIPQFLITAVLAVEDRQFYDHPGVNLRAILRALITDLKAGGFVQGASTITQQLVKTLFLTHEKTLVRKLREALLAVQLERRYTKDEILTLYLNQIYLGSGAYGVGAAARIFFGKALDELTLGECALIAAMPRAPSRYSPQVNPELARQRRDLVLKQMAATGIVAPELARQAAAEPLTLAAVKPRIARAPYFTAYVSKTLEDQIGADLLYQGGLTITSTLNADLQQTADSALTHGLANLE